MWCSPAKEIINSLGGLTRVAEIAAVSTTTVQRWRLPKEKGGADGFIPRKNHDALIHAFKTNGMEVLPSAFLDIKFWQSAKTSQTSQERGA